jgi:non-canonical poly(A) RNA polymerase PAPD5/7
MLVLRDPADETNDLGRKAIAIKHVQATFKSLYHYLARDLAMNTRHSLLGPLVGASYMLNKERRQKTQDYGQRLSQQVQKTLAAKARRVRESEGMEQVDTQVKDNIKSNGSQGSRFEHFPTKEVNSTVEKRSIESTSLEEREGSTKI